jgi:predicted nucleotidyltransferase
MSQLLKLNPNFVPAFDGKIEAEKLVKKLNDSIKVEEAYLFGSSAIDKNTIDSDLDILVIVPDKSDRKIYFKLVSQKNFSKIATDWIFMTQSEFDLNQNIGGVAMIAKQQGVKIF